jgi:hypothetical protein
MRVLAGLEADATGLKTGAADLAGFSSSSSLLEDSSSESSSELLSALTSAVGAGVGTAGAAPVFAC